MSARNSTSLARPTCTTSKKEGGLTLVPCDVITLVTALNIALDRDAHKPRRAENWGQQVGEDGHVTELYGELTGAVGPQMALNAFIALST